MGNIIEVQDLKKIYAGKVPTPALKGVTFTLTEGEFVAVMGKSGSGKSTLLHCLGLLDEPTGGKIVLDNVDINKLTNGEKTDFRLTRLGYIFQEFALLNELTALENVCLPNLAKNHSNLNTAKKTARELLIKVGLGNRLHHYPNELSGGEQQRVAITRALINKPRILLADEPCANLDTANSEEILNFFSVINRETKQTIIMISHEPEDKKWVNKIIWLKDGMVERQETTN